MPLTSDEIRQRLVEFNFDSSSPAHQFSDSEQIQPSSVDLRLCTQFWRLRKGGSISLKRSALLELSPRRYWKPVGLSPSESIKLKPGELLLARTCESFTIPGDCCAIIHGRSSFARLGLSIHCSSGYINPGYSGRMPLQLFNQGIHTIEFIPYIPICQLVIFPLSSKPSKVYGDEALFSKYMDDDGGPSYWWRDKRIRRLREELGMFDIADSIQDRITP